MLCDWRRKYVGNLKGFGVEDLGWKGLEVVGLNLEVSAFSFNETILSLKSFVEILEYFKVKISTEILKTRCPILLQLQNHKLLYARLKTLSIVFHLKYSLISCIIVVQESFLCHSNVVSIEGYLSRHIPSIKSCRRCS